MTTRLPLSRELDPFAAEAVLQSRGDLVRCTACAHRCVVAEGRAGSCGVRFVRDGTLWAPRGYVARTYVRPIETNTVYHVRPGTKALTFGMFGCDLRCGYCHNWKVSQALREPSIGIVGEEHPRAASAEAIAVAAIANGCAAVCAAYNEPMIAAEWVREVFAACRARGLTTVIVSDGHSTPEALDHVAPVTDVFRVDLKGFTPEHYKALGGRIEPVLESIAGARARGLWVEVVTLVVPGFNDDASGLRRIADQIAAIDKAIPWHLNAFQPRYKMKDRPPPSPMFLTSIAGIGYGRGLRFVYVGNVHDVMPELEHTRCPACHATLIERASYAATRVSLSDGRCPCGESIPGVWAPPEGSPSTAAS